MTITYVQSYNKKNAPAVRSTSLSKSDISSANSNAFAPRGFDKARKWSPRNFVEPAPRSSTAREAARRRAYHRGGAVVDLHHGEAALVRPFGAEAKDAVRAVE